MNFDYIEPYNQLVMKYTALIFICFSFSVFAQDSRFPGILAPDAPQSASRQLLLLSELQRKVEEDFSPEDVEGSPYLYDNFVLGEVSINNKSEGLYPLRLNVYNDIFEIKTDESTIKELRQLHYVEINLQNQLYRLITYLNDDKVISRGYFEVLEEGKNVILLKKNNKIFESGVKAKTSFHIDKKPQIKNEVSYYLNFKNNSNVPIKLNKLSSKEVLKAFPKDRIQILKLYIKREKLNLKEVGELLQVIRYYNTL